MITFKDLKFGPHPNIPGIRATVSFANGYTASVINTPFTFREGYEVAILLNGSVVCDTPIADGVVGGLSEQDVTNLLNAIAALPKAKA